MELISRGAEANIYGGKDRIKKERVVKGYRAAELDEYLRKTRTKREAKLISLARRAGVPTPFVYDVDNARTTLEMENIEGRPVREILDDLDGKERERICREIGRSVGRLHCANIVHGDLTTANMLLCGEKVYFIDFGLGEVSESIEDKGVDLLVFKKALYSTHYACWAECYAKFLKGYSEYDEHEDVVRRLKAIERRGRYFSERG
ncbi:MAG: KEOPS complex kinase/ATPase Bud32 [Candidatus Hydrothermarchaeaceae archaeon]